MTTKNRILHIADLHLGDSHAYLGALAAERRREANLVFHRITEHALESGRIGGIVIAGDLFDHYAPAGALVDSVLADLVRLREAGIRTLTVPGNHDEYSYPRCVYRERESVWPDTLVTRPTPGKVAEWDLEGIRVDLYAMAFIAGRSRPPFDVFEIESSFAQKIAVLHGSLDTSWSDRSIPLSRTNLQKLDLDYIALGHLHRPRETRLGRGWVAYPGRIEGSSFHDPGGSPLLEVEVTKDGCQPHRVPFPSQKIESLRWNLSILGSESEIEKRLEREQERDATRILQVTVEGVSEVPVRVEAILERWRGRFRHLEIRATHCDAPDLESLAAETTVRGQFVKIARTRIAEATNDNDRALAQAALRAGLSAFAGN